MAIFSFAKVVKDRQHCQLQCGQLALKPRTTMLHLHPAKCIIVMVIVVFQSLHGIDACVCKASGRFCGDQLSLCPPDNIYECARADTPPTPVATCALGCTISLGVPACWQKASTTIEVK